MSISEFLSACGGGPAAERVRQAIARKVSAGQREAARALAVAMRRHRYERRMTRPQLAALAGVGLRRIESLERGSLPQPAEDVARVRRALGLEGVQ